jgi:H+-transporting ATPase
LLVCTYGLHWELGAIQTLALVTLMFGGEATFYSLRGRNHFWRSRPGNWLIVATVADILIISVLAVGGFAMQAVPLSAVVSVWVAALLYLFLLDLVKVPVFRYFQIF